MAQPNIFILAADNNPQLLPLLRSTPTLASSQDTHGYSLLHAAASYHHLSLLRALVNEFHVSSNIKDEDGESPLFSVESVEVAKCLVEELGVDIGLRNDEGMTAEEKISDEGDWPLVAAYLHQATGGSHALRTNGGDSDGAEATTIAQAETNGVHPPPPLPPNVTVDVGTMEEEASAEHIDPEFKRRIEELAARDDFQGEEGQRQLRDLITDAVRGVATNDGREVRRRVDRS
ncbi:MAG: hypothetical protein M1827_003274 [Pycnora praestabilis]|nr:MAG: hypothetical protein M1827_003274 [Pycnora praestabilis]